MSAAVYTIYIYLHTLTKAKVTAAFSVVSVNHHHVGT